MNFTRSNHDTFRFQRIGFIAIAVLGLALIVAGCSEATDAPEDTVDTDSQPTEDASSTAPTPEQEREHQATESSNNEQAGETAEPTASESDQGDTPEPTPQGDETSEPTPAPTQAPEPMNLPPGAFLEGMAHMYQTMNNCSAASVCMLLSHYDIQEDQEALRPVMRPNDDTKHGKKEYIIGYLEEQGFSAELMHGGAPETLKAFLANDIPVIVQQWLELEDDPIGHYRVVRGYDDNAGEFRVNDSMLGDDVRIDYETFDEMWKAFSYRFIPVYPPENEEIARQILGEEFDTQVNRERTAEQIESELQDDPDNAELWYSLGTNLHDLGRDQEAVQAYERASELGLPRRMLWYVYWPADAYNNLGQHERALEIANQEIESAQTFGDMRFQRARAFEGLGQADQAIAEYRRALDDDPKLVKAEEALARLEAS